jgi:4-aminobutyrate aminotransferase-like enzyme
MGIECRAAVAGERAGLPGLFLAGTDGPHHNVIKLRPPLVFARDDADLFITTLDRILHEDVLRSSP